jgi:hypothetical protein
MSNQLPSTPAKAANPRLPVNPLGDPEARIRALEEKVAKLESVIAVVSPGHVEIKANELSILGNLRVRRPWGAEIQQLSLGAIMRCGKGQFLHENMVSVGDVIRHIYRHLIHFNNTRPGPLFQEPRPPGWESVLK